MEEKKVITIIIKQGLIDNIKGLPKDYIAKIIDLDVKKESPGDPYFHFTDGKAIWR